MNSDGRRVKLTSAIPSARKAAPRIRSCAAGLLGSASRTARNTKEEIILAENNLHNEVR